MPLYGWQKDVLLPSNWFYKKIEWKDMSGRERRAFECCSEDGSLFAGHNRAFLHLLGISLVYTHDVVDCFKLFTEKNEGMWVSQEEQENLKISARPALPTKRVTGCNLKVGGIPMVKLGHLAT